MSGSSKATMGGRVIASLLLSLALACASGGSDPKPSEVPSDQPSALTGGLRVGDIQVVQGDGMPAGDHAEQFEKYAAAEELRDALRSGLGKSGKYADGGEVQLEVRVDDFRLRSGGGAFWLGAMAGADFIKVEVVAKRGGQTVKTYRTDTSTALGGVAYASPTRRTARMIESLAARIENGL